MYRTLSSINTGVITSAQQHLPVLPKMYSKMLSMIEQDRSLKEIAALIETDPPCTVNVLKLVNSSFYGMSINSVHQALVYLGINSVKDLVLVAELFNNSGDLSHENLRIQLNRHMIISSTLLHGLHQHLLARRIPEEFSVTGLLADIGRLVMINYFPDTYVSIMQSYRNPQEERLCDLERKAVGYCHTELGGLLLDWWNLPASSVEAALYHHTYPITPHVLPVEIMSIIHIADSYAWQIAECIEHISVPDEVVDTLSITSKQLDEYVSSILNRADLIG
jgi:HD-like signal output (HDOD) protein